MPATVYLTRNHLRAGMVGLGMIFQETYRPLFEQLHAEGLFRHDFGFVDVELAAVASRTGRRAEMLREEAGERLANFISCTGDDSGSQLLRQPVDVVCIATPDNRHFETARAALLAGKHVLIEKPSVLHLQQLDELTALAAQNNVLCKVVYHKLADPDHKRLRTLVLDGTLRHVNSGYCSLLEPKLISSSQFTEWIGGRNPATYVACHYIKLIDFSFCRAGGRGGSPHDDRESAWRLDRIAASGQRGLVGPADGDTWDSVHLQLVYVYPDRREAAFDIHTSWVMPDNYPGYVEQEVQFRFDNAIWNAHQRKRGVEIAIEEKTPFQMKTTPNHHYNALTADPWGGTAHHGYGIEILRRFFEEVAFVEFGDDAQRGDRLAGMRARRYNDASADRNVVATVQALEAILDAQRVGHPGSIVRVNAPAGGLVLYRPGSAEPEVLYAGRV
jgi:predicted dehydrogenase